MSTKGELVKGMFSKLRISGITLIPSPEMDSEALNVMEDMLAELQERDMCMGYLFEDIPDPASEVGIKRGFENMIKTNLAMRMAGIYGKTPSGTLAFDASQSMSNCQGRLLVDSTRQVEYPSRMPIGSGNQRITNQLYRYYGASTTPPVSCDTPRIAIGEINDYIENYHAYLGAEVISSFTIESSNGLVIQSSSNTDDKVLYRIKAVSGSELGTLQQVKIVITTDSGRIESRIINFEILKDDLA